jgi:protein SCO1/2
MKYMRRPYSTFVRTRRSLTAVAPFLCAAVLATSTWAHQEQGTSSAEVLGGLGNAGPFDLVDHRGRPVGQQDLSGRFALIYFGFTHCVDVCPPGLGSITTALNRLGPVAAAIQAVFISIDHKRDEPATMAAYLADFHPSLIGLTGDKDQVFGAAVAYGMRYYSGVVAGNLEVSHLDLIFVQGPDGRLLARLRGSTPPARLSQLLRELVDGGSGTRTTQGENQSS